METTPKKLTAKQQAMIAAAKQAPLVLSLRKVTVRPGVRGQWKVPRPDFMHEPTAHRVLGSDGALCPRTLRSLCRLGLVAPTRRGWNIRARFVPAPRPVHGRDGE
jgi:hypothetical protein